jgi:hypothetical protein
VEEAAETIATLHQTSIGEDDGIRRQTGRPLSKTLMWPGVVVVLDELAEDMFEVSAAEDQQVVEALAANGANPALGEGVRARAPVGSPEYPDTFGAEDLVKRGGELGVAIPEQELEREAAVLDFPGEVACLLHDPCAGRMVGAAGEVNAAAADLDEEEDVELGQPGGVDDEEVDCEEMVSMLAEELVPRALAATRSGRQAMAAEQAADGEV